ncbi:TetR/AcrR family transcriptional regulator [Psychromonas ossibalaenae]|uniref:TetR/AcrR family transcriptional regulator n=1 Tax=Psychromonas ossibalaenae TaxID=444922 RepID=UPI00036B5D9A|nr:TetR/AcrR family transcriptional regulator [Psychromonas ossibalaenae]
MAKNSQQEALLTEQRIHQAIIDIFMEQGWQAVTYGSLAKHTGLSRGGVQRIVPNKEAMLNAFQGQIFQSVAGRLDFTTSAALFKSWNEALDNAQFRHCIKYLITAVNADCGGKQKAKAGLDKLADMAGKDNMHSLLGIAIYRLLD